MTLILLANIERLINSNLFMIKMPKVFQCSSCGGQHKRPVGAKCQYKNNDNAESTLSGNHSTQSTSENTNAEILNALNAVS